MKILVLVFFYFVMEADEARKYSKCEMIEELKKHGLKDYKGISIGHCKFFLLGIHNFLSVFRDHLHRYFLQYSPVPRMNFLELLNIFKCSTFWKQVPVT